MRELLCVVAIAMAACGGGSTTQPTPISPPCGDPHARSREALEELTGEIEKREAAFAASPAAPDDPAWVKEKLAHMVEIDQLARRSIAWPSERGFEPADAEFFEARVFLALGRLDSKNTRELADLIRRHGWFRISTWGVQADNQAFLLVQHADLNLAFQREMLELLSALYLEQETTPSNYAYLYDRVARGEDRPQRFGTQGKCTGKGAWVEFELEEPARVDELRATVGLPPMAEYRPEVAQFCY